MEKLSKEKIKIIRCEFDEKFKKLDHYNDLIDSKMTDMIDGVKASVYRFYSLKKDHNDNNYLRVKNLLDKVLNISNEVINILYNDDNVKKNIEAMGDMPANENMLDNKLDNASNQCLVIQTSEKHNFEYTNDKSNELQSEVSINSLKMDSIPIVKVLNVDSFNGIESGFNSKEFTSTSTQKTNSCSSIQCMENSTSSEKEPIIPAITFENTDNSHLQEGQNEISYPNPNPTELKKLDLEIQSMDHSKCSHVNNGGVVLDNLDKGELEENKSDNSSLYINPINIEDKIEEMSSLDIKLMNDDGKVQDNIDKTDIEENKSENYSLYIKPVDNQEIEDIISFDAKLINSCDEPKIKSTIDKESTNMDDDKNKSNASIWSTDSNVNKFNIQCNNDFENNIPVALEILDDKSDDVSNIQVGNAFDTQVNNIDTICSEFESAINIPLMNPAPFASIECDEVIFNPLEFIGPEVAMKRFPIYLTRIIDIPSLRPINVIISSVISPSLFFCQIDNTQVCSLNKKVHEYFEINQTCANIIHPEIGEIIGAWSNILNQICRARIIQIQSNYDFTSLQVFYIDCGHIDWVCKEQIYILPEHLTILPVCSFMCSLVGVQPPKNSHMWSDTSVTYFNYLLKGKQKFTLSSCFMFKDCIFVDLGDRKGRSLCKLFNESIYSNPTCEILCQYELYMKYRDDSMAKSINDTLVIGYKLIQKLQVINCIYTQENPFSYASFIVNTSMQCEPLMPNSNSPIDLSEEHSENYSSSCCSRSESSIVLKSNDISSKELRKIEAFLNDEHNALSPFMTGDVLSETVDFTSIDNHCVKITNFEDIHTFYIQSLNPKAKKRFDCMHKYLNILLKWNFTHNVMTYFHEHNSFPPGTIGCSQFKQDNMFYRCKVIEKLDHTDKLKVFYIDIGDCDIIKTEELFMLPKNFYQIDPFAIKVSFYDLEYSEGKESVTDDIIKQINQTIKLISHFKMQSLSGVSPSLNFVELISDEDDINISKDLVSMGCCFRPSLQGNSFPISIKDLSSNDETDSVSEMDKWDPLSTDYNAFTNDYDIDLEDTSYATNHHDYFKEANICPYFLNGNCWLGSNCKRIHTYDTSKYIISDIVTENPLPIGSRIIVQVISVLSECDIYVVFPFGYRSVTTQQSLEISKFKELHDSQTNLQSIMKKHKKRCNVESFCTGQYCIVSIKNNFYRAKFLSSSEVKAKVFLIDFGIYKYLKHCNIFEFTKYNCHVPKQAIHVSITNISAPLNSTFTKEMSKELFTLMSGKCLSAEVVDIVESDKLNLFIIDTTIIDKMVDKYKCIQYKYEDVSKIKHYRSPPIHYMPG